MRAILLKLWLMILPVLAMGQVCDARDVFANDLNKSKELRDYTKSSDQAQDAWFYLYESGLNVDKRTDINELTLVSKNLEAIKSAKGYLNWKALQGAGSLVSKLNNALFSVLKGKVNQLDNVSKSQFLDDFANASDDVLKKLQEDNLFDVWKNDIRSNSIDDLIAFKSRGSLRSDYITAVNSIANKASELKALGKTDLEIAQEVFNLRRQTTINFKGATPDDMLDIIYEFNDIRYTQTGLGDKWGLSWNGAVTKATKNGVTDYSKIISGASTPLGDKQVLGKALYDIVGTKTLPVLQKYRMTSLIP